MEKQKITFAECKEIAQDLINGLYDQVVFFVDGNGNQSWEPLTSGTQYSHDPDHVGRFSYVNEYNAGKTELAIRMHKILN